jgi:hypothetical protein
VTTPYGGGNKINIQVTTISGIHITLIVTLNDTTDQLKRIVCQKTGIPDYQQILTYNGKVLSNGWRIYEYNIRNMSTVLLVTQVDGG